MTKEKRLTLLDAISKMTYGAYSKSKNNPTVYHIEGCYIVDEKSVPMSITNYHILVDEWIIVEKPK